MAEQRDTASVGESTSIDRKPIFGIFEGGGAKGIAHVGACAAVDELQLEFIGVAGASAGSIVAALLAVGFSAKDLFDPENRSGNIFAMHGLSPLEVLGKKDWKRLHYLRRCWRPVLLILVASVVIAFLFALAGRYIAALWMSLLTMSLIGGIYWWGKSYFRARGIFDPLKFAAVFNGILRTQVEAMYRAAGMSADQIPERICFKDIDIQRVPKFCRLKVVVTDISGEQLVLFDHRTPDVVVAEAVAASIAIPGVFRPANMPSFAEAEATGAGPRYYADGGLVSNLPVWCFAEEKAATERRKNSAAVPVVAFTLGESGSNIGSSEQRPLEYFKRVLRTAVFGGQVVVQDFVNDLCAVQLKCELGVLAFDTTWEQARNAYIAAKQQAKNRLSRRLVVEPREWARVLGNASADISAAILSHVGESVRLNMRASVFEPIRSLRHQPSTNYVTAYRVTHAFNMASDADDRLTLDAESPGVPIAFQERNLVLWDPSKATSRPPVMTKYERALVRCSVKSAICIPIFRDAQQWKLPIDARSQVLAVAAFDTDAAIITLLTDATNVLSRITEATFNLGALLAES